MDNVKIEEPKLLDNTGTSDPIYKIITILGVYMHMKL